MTYNVHVHVHYIDITVIGRVTHIWRYAMPDINDCVRSLGGGGGGCGWRYMIPCTRVEIIKDNNMSCKLRLLLVFANIQQVNIGEEGVI